MRSSDIIIGTFRLFSNWTFPPALSEGSQGIPRPTGDIFHLKMELSPKHYSTDLNVIYTICLLGDQVSLLFTNTEVLLMETSQFTLSSGSSSATQDWT